MAKINAFIAEYKDALVKTGLPSDGVVPTKKVLQRFLRLFRNVDDSRLIGMVDYPLEEIILIAFLAVLGNASTWIEMADFGKSKKKWLKKIMKLENGIPSHDTFRRVFSLMDTVQLQEVTVAFLLENLAAIKKSLKIKDDGFRQICVDGKEQRGTGRKYKYDKKIRNLQTLHVYDASNEICLYSKAISEKTNEISVAQKILESMNLKKCIVTFDALHTQKLTIAIIANQKGEYIGGLKGNQGSLQKDAEKSFTPEKLIAIKKTDNYYTTSEKAHGKLEVRRYYLAKANHVSNSDDEWTNLRNFICYEKYTYDVISGEESTEMRYYITSLRDVKTSAEAIRGHWGIENKLHWHLDYSFKEDDNTNIDVNAFNNLSLISKMVLSLCKLAQPVMNNKSIRLIRKNFSWEFEDRLAELLICFDADAILKALESNKK